MCRIWVKNYKQTGKKTKFEKHYFDYSHLKLTYLQRFWNCRVEMLRWNGLRDEIALGFIAVYNRYA